MSRNLPRAGGDAVQCMPIENHGSTSGAANIDVTNMAFIEFDSAVTVYWEGETSKTFDVAKNKIYGVEGINTLHVSAAVNYIWL